MLPQGQMSELTVAFDVADVAASVQFYEGLEVGFRFRERGKTTDGQGEWAEVTFNNVLLVLDPMGPLAGSLARGLPLGQGVTTIFRLPDFQDIDTVYEKLVAKGVDIVNLPDDQPWGQRDFTFIDPDGYMVGFTQHLSVVEAHRASAARSAAREKAVMPQGTGHGRE